jgi:mono/diheme cytochrome c family protein
LSGTILPAHGLGDVVARPSYFNGATSDLLEAINHCRADWMDAPPLLEEDDAYRSQLTFLESFWPQGLPAPALQYNIVAPTDTSPSQGDPLLGCELFERTCKSCHGSLGLGLGTIAPSIWSGLPSSLAWRQRIRLSGPNLVLVPDTLHNGLLGNRMPFWSAQRLSDAQVENLVAYLTIGDDPSRRACDSAIQPPRIISAGTFQTILHGVRGTAEYWSDQKIRLKGFFYDGRGPLEVLVWLYLKDQNDFHAILRGIRISSHLARDDPYRDVDLEFDIPDGVTGETFNAVSIWCTEFQTNYGEAELEE